jgi:hypothetical protein
MWNRHGAYTLLMWVGGWAGCTTEAHDCSKPRRPCKKPTALRLQAPRRPTPTTNRCPKARVAKAVVVKPKILNHTRRIVHSSSTPRAASAVVTIGRREMVVSKYATSEGCCQWIRLCNANDHARASTTRPAATSKPHAERAMATEIEVCTRWQVHCDRVGVVLSGLQLQSKQCWLALRARNGCNAKAKGSKITLRHSSMHDIQQPRW